MCDQQSRLSDPAIPQLCPRVARIGDFWKAVVRAGRYVRHEWRGIETKRRNKEFRELGLYAPEGSVPANLLEVIKQVCG